MMKSSGVMRACLMALSSLAYVPAVTAANRTWVGGNNDWDANPANWVAADEPDANDIATFNTPNSVDLANAFEEILGLTMSGGIRLSTNGNSMAVSGLIQLSDTSTDLVVEGNSSILTADAITINSGAEITVIGGQLGVFGEPNVGLLDVNAGGDLTGNGLVLLADSVAAGVELLELDGTLTAASTVPFDLNSTAAATLTISVSDADGVLDLDGNGSNSTININRNDTLAINGGVLDSVYSGTINLGSGGTISRNVAWSFNGFLYTVPGSTAGAFSAAATIAGAAFTQSGGSINVDSGESLRFSSSTFNTTNGTINNSGHIIFDSNTTDITGITFDMTGPTASLTVTDGSWVDLLSNDLELDGAGTATNVVTIGANSRLNLTLSGAADQSFTGTINLNGGRFEVVTNDNNWSLGGTLNVGSTHTSVIGGEKVTLNGQVNIGADSVLSLAASATIESGAAVSGSGGTLINLNGAALTIQNGAMVEVPIVNQGTLVLGAEPGQIMLPRYTQTEMGRLEIELGGAGANETDRLIVTGQAFIAGTLYFSLIDNFIPSAGETFDFFAAAGGITGAFDTINLPELPAGLFWIFKDDNPTMLQLMVSLPGDYNQNSSVDAADYVVWRKTDGTQAGYDRWRANFGATSPGTGAGSGPAGVSPSHTTVPEPSSAWLLILAAISSSLTDFRTDPSDKGSKGRSTKSLIWARGIRTCIS